MTLDNTDSIRRAAVDITTGYGADSFFVEGALADPWADESLEALVDVLVNHPAVVSPLPSRAAMFYLDDHRLPATFAAARRQGLLDIKTDVTADDVVLEPDLLKKEYESFAKWAWEEPLFPQWVRYQYETPSIRKSRRIYARNPLVREFWLQRGTQDLACQLHIPDDRLSYAFDVYSRTIQYHSIMGETSPCFFHPVRTTALSSVTEIGKYQRMWSWGRYLKHLLTAHQVEHASVEWLMETTAQVREHSKTHKATWYELEQKGEQEQYETLNTIASSLSLPAKIKESVHKDLVDFLAVVSLGSTPLAQLAHEPWWLVTMILSAGVIGVKRWKGWLPGEVAKLKILRGYIERPGLTS